jgi:predicted NodU family carbamoyl transferase
MFKELQQQKEKVQKEQQLSSKLEVAEMIKKESEKMMERLLKTEKKLAKTDKIMKQSGVVDLAYVNSEFTKLKDYMELYDYGKVFYWTMLNYLAAYRALIINLQKAN